MLLLFNDTHTHTCTHTHTHARAQMHHDVGKLELELTGNVEGTTAGDWTYYLNAAQKLGPNVWPQFRVLMRNSKTVGAVLMPAKGDTGRPRTLILVPNEHHGVLVHDINPHGYLVRENGQVPLAE